MPLPNRIQNAPELFVGLELYFNAFLDLSTCRAVGAAVGPIPFTAALSYCEMYQIEGEQREDFLWLMQRLDHKYLKWSASRERPSGVQPSNNPPGRDDSDPSR